MAHCGNAFREKRPWEHLEVAQHRRGDGVGGRGRGDGAPVIQRLLCGMHRRQLPGRLDRGRALIRLGFAAEYLEALRKNVRRHQAVVTAATGPASVSHQSDGRRAQLGAGFRYSLMASNVPHAVITRDSGAALGAPMRRTKTEMAAENHVHLRVQPHTDIHVPRSSFAAPRGCPCPPGKNGGRGGVCGRWILAGVLVSHHVPAVPCQPPGVAARGVAFTPSGDARAGPRCGVPPAAPHVAVCMAAPRLMLQPLPA